MGQGALSSAPDEATLRAGLHRRGLVGALMFWHGDFRRTWTATLLMITFALLFSYIALRRMVRSGSSKQIRSLWQISTDLAQDNMIDYSELDLESDEYESEDEDDSSVTGLSSDTKMSHALRRALRKDHNSVSKRSSLIMITSSDPLSSLSTRPIQIELEGSKVKSLSPLNPLSGASTVTYGTPPNEAPSNPIVKRSLSASSSGSIGRRRRESGRLLVGSSSSRGNSASPSPARSADGSRPQRPPRTRPVDVKNRSQVVQPLQAASPLTRSTTEDGWTDDVGLGEEGKENTSTPSISTERSFALPAESDDVEFRRGRLVTRDVEGADGRYEAGKRPQFPRLSSILKREAQPFRTASLRGTELSTLIQQPDSASNEGSPLWDVRRDNHQSPSLNPGDQVDRARLVDLCGFA
ncbi:hypothetical protein IE53DRAFT_110211 [Violaceomyces palustris]|uniref:Uncharacterized protein n=1 Tax=Violaceomyces palustris TaxID=1673888 RepID=A0ACD0NW75_9BASI|nr:hypothetical protein IE53DRAFT_110211 [Violaceomyces palustris]